MIKINKERTASFDVDAQNTFTPLCPNELPVPDALSIVSGLNDQAKFTSVRIGSKDAHSEKAIWVATSNAPQLTPIDSPNSDLRWNAHGVVGEFGFDLIAGLPKVTEYDFFVWKGIELDMHPYGACYHDLHDKMSTGAIEYMKAKNIDTVIVGGLALEFCVKKTVLQLLDAGFKVIVNLSATKGLDQTACEMTVHELSAQGVTFIKDANELVFEDKSYTPGFF
jgi:nicotinamidase/pyrazinamidase